MFFIRAFLLLCLTITAGLSAQPQPPPSVTATPVNCTSISVSWQAAGGSGQSAPSQYLVCRDTTNTLIATVDKSVTSFTDANAGAYSTHIYAVITKATSGALSVPTWSGSVATGSWCPPDAPTGLAANAPNYNQVNLSWAAPARTGAGLAGYRVYRNGAFITQITATSTANTGLSGSTTYLYEVSSIDSAGRESTKSQVNVTTPASGSPGKAKISFQGDNAVVEWPGSAGVLYQAECSSDFGSTWNPVDTPTTSFAVTNVKS